MKRHPCLLTVLTALAIGGAACQPAPEPETPSDAPKIRLEVGEPVTVPTDQYPGLSYGPRITTLPDGRVLVGRGDVALTTSDSGATWDAGPAIARPHLLPLRNGSYFFLKGRGIAGDEPGLFSLEMAHVQALDENATEERISWSPATARVDRWSPLTADNETEVDYLGIGGPFLELEDGTLLAACYGNFKGDTVPMQGFPATSGQKWFKYRTYLLSSNDGGANWEYLSTIAYDGDTGQESFCEPAMVDLGGGELLAVMRTGRFAPMFQARSLDGGKTWQKPESMHIPGLAPQMVLLENGALVCSFGWRRLKVGYGHGLNDEGGPYPGRVAGLPRTISPGRGHREPVRSGRRLRDGQSGQGKDLVRTPQVRRAPDLRLHPPGRHRTRHHPGDLSQTHPSGSITRTPPGDLGAGMARVVRQVRRGPNRPKDPSG